MKKPGSKAYVFLDSFDDLTRVVNGNGTNTTEPGIFYFILKRGSSSALPLPEGGIFKSPATGNDQVILKSGDQIFPLLLHRFFKTAASFQAEQGSVDVTDDGDEGSNSEMLDGYTTLSGSLSGFFDYDDVKGEFSDATMEIINRFFDVVEDDGEARYRISKQNSSPMFMMILLNNDAKTGQFENWLLFPVIIKSFSTNLGIKDAQNMDMSFSKGQGKASIYKVPKTEVYHGSI